MESEEVLSDAAFTNATLFIVLRFLVVTITPLVFLNLPIHSSLVVGAADVVMTFVAVGIGILLTLYNLLPERIAVYFLDSRSAPMMVLEYATLAAMLSFYEIPILIACLVAAQTNLTCFFIEAVVEPDLPKEEVE